MFRLYPRGIYVNNGSVFSSFLFGGESTTGTDTVTTVVDVTGADGRVWMDRNLGATQVATSSTDVASYGDLYQWGRAKDGHELRTSTITNTTATSGFPGHGNFITADSATDYNWTDFAEEDDLWQSGLNDPCPLGYRVPIEAELEGERAHFSPSNAVGIFNSPLKLPLSDFRFVSSGTLNAAGVLGYYWSSTVEVGSYVRILYFGSGAVSVSSGHRASGFVVRCLKD